MVAGAVARVVTESTPVEHQRRVHPRRDGSGDVGVQPVADCQHAAKAAPPAAAAQSW